MPSDCPCCSGVPYEQCCKPLHDGTEAASVLALMRSRFAAYALGKPEYIQRTTHPKSPFFEKNRDRWTAGILEFCKTTEFCRLFIFGYGPTHVYFAAQLKQNGESVTLTENSRFEQVDGRWLYVDGEVARGT